MFAARMLLIPLGIFSLTAAAEAAPGKIEEVGKGTLVKVSRAGTVVRLKKGDALQSGDEVTTDAETAVDIRLEDETLIRVGVNSAYRIQEDSKINSLVHRLLSGVVRVLVPKSEAKSSAVKFRLYTPEGTIGVRGTEFVVIRSNGKTQLKGLDGTVMFGPVEADFSNDSIFVNVGRGFHSTVSQTDKTASKPEKFDLPKYLQEINGKAGQFGPLAARVEGTKMHARVNVPASLPVAAVAAAKPAIIAQEIPQKKPAVGGGVNQQKLLLEGALNGDLKQVREAMQKGAEVNSTNEIGVTALQMALTEKSEKHKDVVIYLIANGANVNIKDKQGLTPLMFVAEHKLDIEYARALVDPGAADMTAEDRQGRIPAEIARAVGYEELTAYLESQAAIDDYNNAVEERAARKKK